MKKELEQELLAYIDGPYPFLSKLCEFIAFIKEKIPQANWVGFYSYEKGSGDLFLGPFQGEPACILIKKGKGVCGECVKQGKSIIVDDVSKLDNYICCSTSTKSELVAPVFNTGFLIGVMDLDSDDLAAFTVEDEQFLNEAIEIFSKNI